jgi:hypothetical protein
VQQASTQKIDKHSKNRLVTVTKVEVEIELKYFLAQFPNSN